MNTSTTLLAAAFGAVFVAGTSAVLFYGDGGTEASSDPAAAAQAVVDERPAWERSVQGGPGPRLPDLFYPGFDPKSDTLPTPKRGGRVLVHMSTLPKNINYMVENSAWTRRVLYEVHETLVQRDWENWDHKPILADTWIMEDTVILKGGRGANDENVRYGEVTEDGDEYVVTPKSPDNPHGEVRVAKSDVDSVQKATVFTFHLKDGIKWHDGHPLDTQDILFSFNQYFNPNVDCDTVRYKFELFQRAEALDAKTIRFFYKKQYFLAVDAFIDLTILPSHVYDLADPDNPDHDADATESEQGSYINDHPNNTMWIGLGPYRVTEWNQQYIETERFDDYFNQDDAGYVDAIRYRHIPSDDAAKQALINGELDYWERMRSEDYYGEYVQQNAFVEHYYKGIASYNYFGYTTWNMRRPKFADPNVRRALNMTFDWDEYIETVANGLASRVTGSPYYFAPHYNHAIEPVPYDPEGAEDLLLEAGWYDRDGDGIVDKDGVPFEIEFLMPTGNKASDILGQKIQENLGGIGVKVNIATREWATFLERLYDRDYDCANLAWIMDVESDPEQIWHSSWADVERSSNHCGLKDPEVDELIEAIQVELDKEKRQLLFHRMQARLYELQPYMFGLTQPKKFAMSKRIRNFKNYAIDPGWRIREWYIDED